MCDISFRVDWIFKLLKNMHEFQLLHFIFPHMEKSVVLARSGITMHFTLWQKCDLLVHLHHFTKQGGDEITQVLQRP